MTHRRQDAGWAAQTTGAGKLVAAILLSIALASCPLRSASLGAALLVVLAVVLVTRGTRRAARTAVPVCSLLAVTLVPLAATEGALHAALVFGRALLTVTAAVALAGAIPKSDLSASLRALGVPSALAAIVGSALRNVSVLRDEGRRLLLARRLRGRDGYADGAALLGALLARASLRAERAALAMDLRGHDAGRAIRDARLRPVDAPLLAFSAAGALFVHSAAHLVGP